MDGIWMKKIIEYRKLNARVKVFIFEKYVKMLPASNTDVCESGMIEYRVKVLFSTDFINSIH